MNINKHSIKTTYAGVSVSCKIAMEDESYVLDKNCIRMSFCCATNSSLEADKARQRNASVVPVIITTLQL